MQIDVQVLDKHFYLKKPLLKRFCRKVIQNAWKGKPDVQISVVLADNDFVQLLNKRYRKKDKPTNVLSFENEWPLAGDIIVAYGVTRDEAIAQGKTFAAHLAHLLTHGTLHLQKYDHLTEKQAQKMEKMETKLMRQLGYADPYKGV